MPEISVVIPSYNHAAFIGQAIESVLGQSRADLELIVVDDGSSDNSLDIIHGYNDARLRVTAQKNQGAHAAINRGLAMASGKYLAVLNSDDVYAPQRLEKLVPLLAESPDTGLAASYIEVIDGAGKPLGIKHGYQDLSPWALPEAERSFRAGTDLRAALLTENYLSTTSNYLFSRRWFERVGGFRPLRYAHDWDFALRMARVAGIALLEEPLLQYRVHGHNTIRENQAAMIFEICWILAVHLPGHVADPDWFDQAPPEVRADQLLHSLYTFGMDRLLNVLLLQGLGADENEAKALALLQPGNPIRDIYLEYIQTHLETQPTAAPQAMTLLPRLLAGVRRRVLGEEKRS